jgi:hypothetical protein
MSIMAEIQGRLKANKGQYNSFGKYSYRSCEDIVEALKPILKELGCHLILSDEMILVGDRVYVKATASIVKGDVAIGGAMGNAREALAKKGMDEAQVTGAASSYARKYALNGLLAIDDTKDADSLDNSISKLSSTPIDPNRIISNCKTLGELQTVWSSLSSMQQAELSATKDEAKARLSK